LLWHRQECIEFERELYKVNQLMHQNKHYDALVLLQVLIDKCPEFSEAHNKLATLFFYNEAIS
jgi:hypothetical protein